MIVRELGQAAKVDFVRSEAGGGTGRFAVYGLDVRQAESPVILVFVCEHREQ